MTSSVREAIRQSSRLARMRLGQFAPEKVSIPSMPEIQVDMVPLTEAEAQRGIMRAAEIEIGDNMAGIQVRNRAAIELDVWHSLRDPHDVTKQLFESVETMVDELEPTDIDALADRLATLMEYASPSIDGLSDQDLDDLKKAFMEIQLNELTGRQWAAVKQCFQALLPELLQVKLFGSFSTESSTPTNGSEESISSVSPN
jgi:hypothetical protein